jgi:amidase
LNQYLATRTGVPIRSLKDAIDFNAKNKDREMSYFGQELFLSAEAKGPLTDEAYRKALERNRKLSREGIDDTLKKNRLDAIVMPTGGPPWTTDLVTGDHFLGDSSTPTAVAGYPVITVPMGYVYGLPVGISFAGTAWSEGTLLRLAYAYEQGTKHRHPPALLPVADLRSKTR